LRKEGRRLYPPTQAIRAIKLYHRQVYRFAYHRPKLALLTGAHEHKRFASLAAFLEAVPRSCPHALFRDESGARASQLAADFIDRDNLIVTTKENAATAAAALVLPTVGNNHQRHDRLQRFMLANDSVTVAVEVPVWLDRDAIAALEAQHDIRLLAPESASGVITGHIDFLQIRNGAVHILDYKPDARTNKPIAQLTVYALALTRLVPGLRLFDIKCAWFNEEEYCELFPRTVLRRQ
jgi:hypothetical protein